MNINIGFEIEVENNTRGFAHGTDYHITHNTNLHRLLDLSRDITKWSGYQIDYYHRKKSEAKSGSWRIERDASLYDGAEFIMPPLKKDEAIKTLIEFFKFIPESKCVTTDKCGLHMNISCGDDMTVDNIDLSYLLSNINYRLLYSLWKNRASKSTPYCKLPQDILKKLARKIDWSTGNASQDIKRASLALLGSRENIINLRDFREENDNNVHHYLEIRVMGGKNYHTKINQILATVNSFTELLEKAQLKHDTKKHKRIASYINRVSQKKETVVTLWLPFSNSSLYWNMNYNCDNQYPSIQLNHLLDQLHSVRNICKHDNLAVAKVLLKAYSTKTRSLLDPMPPIRNYNTPYKKTKPLELPACLLKHYTAIIQVTVERYRIFFNNCLISHNNLADLVNALCYSIYYVIKYAHDNKIKNNACNKLINLFLKNKHILTPNDNNIYDRSLRPGLLREKQQLRLVLPKEESPLNLLWLSKYMHKFPVEDRVVYIDSLNKPIVKFLYKHKSYNRGMINIIKKRMMFAK